MNTDSKIVTFTGHRPNRLGGYVIPNKIYDSVRKKLREVLIDIKPEKAYSGMALGWDQWAAEICIELNIPFVAAVPFKGQELIWPEKSQKLYNVLLKQAKEIVEVSEPPYSPMKMQKRNEWMIDKCDILVACFDDTYQNGGTFNALQYAKKQNKNVVIIDPKIF